MIKLILSDIDGTLIHGDETVLSSNVFSEINRLKKLGITFAVASGRQCYSIRKLFAPVAESIYYVAENGTAVFGPGTDGNLLFAKYIDYKTAMELAYQGLEDERCQLMVSNPELCYLVAKNERFEPHIEKYVGNRVKMAKCPEESPDRINKISLYCEDGIETTMAVCRKFQSIWGSRYSVAVAGDRWVDITPADKAFGARVLCERLGITPGDVIAFGDNYNDISMLEFAGKGYIMDNSDEILKRKFEYHCRDVLAELSKIV